MADVYFELENCYGIPKFNDIFTFSADKKAHMIYAPNGIMKTSFANTLRDICSGKETKDCFYPSRKTTRIVKYTNKDGNDVLPDSIMVIEPYSDTYKSENVSVLLANEDLKREYERIHQDIAEKMSQLLSSVAKKSGKRDTNKLIAEDYGYSEKDIFQCLEYIYDTYWGQEFLDLSEIKYGNIITPDAETILKDPTIAAQLKSYIEQYEKLLTSSNVFQTIFNHTSAEDTLKTLGKGGFFKAKHRVLLSGSTEPLDEKQFKSTIETEKKRIIDTDLADEFKKLDDMLSAKAGTKNLRDFIFANKEVIPELLQFDEFKKKLWVSYLLSANELFQIAILSYKHNSKRLKEIIQEARDKISDWNLVVEQFNDRFSNMPFTLLIKNKDDVVLKSEMPVVSFIYKNRGDEIEVPENDLLQHLSNGEKKALYLLNIIFEIEARKSIQKPTLLIMDDIADSFDYRNKYAIIEYIKDIVDCNIFMPIILTHNFDFYRTVASRINIKPTSNFVNKSSLKVELTHGQYFENVFDSWRSQVYKNNPIFISSISFIRNIIEYTCGRKDNDYKNLTSLLHYKTHTENGIWLTSAVTVQDLINVYIEYWNRDENSFCQDRTKKVIDLLMETAEEIVLNCANPIAIENKIVLSIAIRLLTEKYMISRINDSTQTESISGNQTRVLRDLLHFNRTSADDRKIEEIIDRVLIITSENIHINSFMYEPIVDMSLDELITLYNNIKTHLI